MPHAACVSSNRIQCFDGIWMASGKYKTQSSTPTLNNLFS